MKTLTRVRLRVLKLRIWTSKIMLDLWLLDLYCPIKKNSTLHPNVQSVKTKHYIIMVYRKTEIIELDGYSRVLYVRLKSVLKNNNSRFIF